MHFVKILNCKNYCELFYTALQSCQDNYSVDTIRKMKTQSQHKHIQFYLIFEICICVTAKILAAVCSPESSSNKTRTELPLFVDSKQKKFFSPLGRTFVVVNQYLRIWGWRPLSETSGTQFVLFFNFAFHMITLYCKYHIL